MPQAQPHRSVAALVRVRHKFFEPSQPHSDVRSHIAILEGHPVRTVHGACFSGAEIYCCHMALTNLAVAEEALSLSPAERADLAKLLIQSLENDRRSDAEITAELNRRLDDLISGKDTGLSFEQVFGSPA